MGHIHRPPQPANARRTPGCPATAGMVIIQSMPIEKMRAALAIRGGGGGGGDGGGGGQ